MLLCMCVQPVTTNGRVGRSSHNAQPAAVTGPHVGGLYNINLAHSPPALFAVYCSKHNTIIYRCYKRKTFDKSEDLLHHNIIIPIIQTNRR